MDDQETTLRPRNFVLSQGDIARCDVCPASRVFVGPKMKPHPAMWYGIFVHRFLQYAKERGRDAALRYVWSKSKTAAKVCERINVDEIPDGLYEIGLAIDTTDRSAEIAPHDMAEVDRHIYARADTLFYQDDIPHVVDFKTGERSYDPATSVQLLTLACGAHAMEPRPGPVRVSVVNVIKTGELRWSTHEHETAALDDHWKRMRRVHLEVLETRCELRDERLQPLFVPGDHCDNCRAEVACMHKRVDDKRRK